MKEKKYQIFYIDPPYDQNKGGKKKVRPKTSGEKLDYKVISLEKIKEIMQEKLKLGDENNVLFLWTIDKYLFQSQKIAEELGYKLHARMIWDKVTGIPAAFTVRYGHEYLLYMYKGKLLKIALEERGKIHTIFREQVKKHSEKPSIAYRIIERLYPNTNKLELFARKRRQGWDSWGDEVPNEQQTIFR